MNNPKTLVIVESPAKGHKVQEYLGKDYIVMASIGHITDLGKGGSHGIGVDVDNNFRPHYVLSDDKIDVLNGLMVAAKKVDRIFIASDPDREGEAIAWHLAERLADMGKPIKRIVFNEIKKSVVLKAVTEPRDININLFHSQEARRILDRLVGFMASPFLMNCIAPKLSAGRVQSVVTRIVIDREREIEAFTPEEFWTIQVNLAKDKENFITKYSGQLRDAKLAETMRDKFNASNVEYLVSSVTADEDKKFPSAPLVTSTLQRIMSKVHGFAADRTMKAAQTLYESGFCSYIRTDSTRVGDEALEDVRKWIKDNNYVLPKKANLYPNKEAAQDAHECIRPSDLSLAPDNYEIVSPDEKIVYETIWKYFVASQMMPAVYNTLKVTAHVKGDKTAEVKASGKAIKSKGFLDVLGVEDESKIDIPNLSVGDSLMLFGKNPVKMEKKQTQPPPRFSEDKLIKELDARSIGRPATYADLLNKLTARNYVEKKGSVFHATDLGKKITDILTKYFTFMDYNYTAKMEQQLDEIEGGKINHIDMLKKFFPKFKLELDEAYLGHGGTLCNLCGNPMSTRTAKTGSKFLGCSSYPKCRGIVNIVSATVS